MHPSERLLADIPTLYKFLSLRHLPLGDASQILYLDLDTFFFGGCRPALRRQHLRALVCAGGTEHAPELSTGEILFITDAHVEVSQGWDELVQQHIAPNRILTGTVTQQSSGFHGYGCKLLIPFMGTTWNQHDPGILAPVPIATCSATILERDLFFQLGGYDTGMLIYGAGEPEFSVRAWLHGAEIRSLNALEISHEFKAKDELGKYLRYIRPFWVHNALRFGLLYLNEQGCTPDIDLLAIIAGDGQPHDSFWVRSGGSLFPFKVVAKDLAGRRVDFLAPLIFMSNSEPRRTREDHLRRRRRRSRLRGRGPEGRLRQPLRRRHHAQDTRPLLRRAGRLA